MATETNFERNTGSTAHQEVDGGQSPGPQALKEILEGVERDLIVKALKQSHGNKTRAARALGISERVMGIRVKQLGIDWRGMRVGRRAPTGCVCERCGCQIRHSPVPENIKGDVW